MGGFELNLYRSDDGATEEATFELRRYNAGKRRYDAQWSGTFSVSLSANGATAAAPHGACPPVHKRLYDLSYTTDGVNVMARGSFGAVSGIEGLSRGATALLVCGSITLHPSIARGGPLTYELVRAGPSLSYSPLYYETYNGTVGHLLR